MTTESNNSALANLSGSEPERIERNFLVLSARGVAPTFAVNRDDALAAVLGMLPAGAAVAHGSSTTLQEIGVVDHLNRTESGYRYLNREWLAENDPAKRLRLRGKLSLESDYFGTAPTQVRFRTVDAG